VSNPFPALEKPRAVTALRWGIGIVIVLGLLGCVTKGANSPADPYLSNPSSGPASRTRFGDFGETKVTVHNGDKLLTWCMLLASTQQQRARGLMQVKDKTLGGYNGMLFRYDQDVTESFWMRNTPMPLSIAYISSAGQIVTVADMEPCSDSPDCRDYPAAGPYRITIEVPQGNLANLGIVQGATIVDDNAPCAT
jgi:uncharacterized membrane protein (UPF0127 family)